MHLEKTHAIAANADISNERTGEPARNYANGALDRFLWPHKTRGASALDRQLLD
jgi:hypothetical protein